MAERTETVDAAEILRRRYVAGNEGMEALVREQRENLDVAQQIHDLRTAAGLTQQGLADRVGTTASVISRLEDADYEGHSLKMLRRIAAALNSRVEVKLVPLNEPRSKPHRTGSATKATTPKTRRARTGAKDTK